MQQPSPPDHQLNQMQAEQIVRDLQLLDTSYKKRANLGQGEYGCVFLIRRTIQKGQQVHEFACKIFPTSESHRSSLENEREILRDCQSCPYIVQLEARQTVELNNLLQFRSAICIQHMNCGSLDDLIQRCNNNKNGLRRIEETALRSIVSSVTKALGFLTTRNIAHTDVKPGNILLDSDGSVGSVKLCDFNVARRCSAAEINTYAAKDVRDLGLTICELALGACRSDEDNTLWLDRAGELIHPIFQLQLAYSSQINVLYFFNRTADEGGRRPQLSAQVFQPSLISFVQLCWQLAEQQPPQIYRHLQDHPFFDFGTSQSPNWFAQWIESTFPGIAV